MTKKNQLEGTESLEDSLDEELAQFMARGKTQVKAADELNVSKATVNKHLKRSEVQARILALKTNQEEQVQQILKGAWADAVRVIAQIARGTRTITVVDEDGTEREVSLDPKWAALQYKAAVWIAERLEKKRIPEPGEQPGGRRSPRPARKNRDPEDMQEALDRVSS